MVLLNVEFWKFAPVKLIPGICKLDKSALELVVGAVISAVHKYLSYKVIP